MGHWLIIVTDSKNRTSFKALHVIAFESVYLTCVNYTKTIINVIISTEFSISDHHFFPCTTRNTYSIGANKRMFLRTYFDQFVITLVVPNNLPPIPLIRINSTVGIRLYILIQCIHWALHTSSNQLSFWKNASCRTRSLWKNQYLSI